MPWERIRTRFKLENRRARQNPRRFEIPEGSVVFNSSGFFAKTRLQVLAALCRAGRELMQPDRSRNNRSGTTPRLLAFSQLC
jgi:hypothetical protein